MCWSSYGLKALVEIDQMLPAALALGSAIAMSGLRRHGETTALWALGRGPVTFMAPIVCVAAACGLVLFLSQDAVIAPANFKSEEISALRFHPRWGDWGLYHRQQQWFHGNEGRFFHLDHVDGEGFGDVSVYDVSPDFRLARRTDAARIQPLGGGQWKMTDVVRRVFGEGSTLSEERLPMLVWSTSPRISMAFAFARVDPRR